MNKVQGELITAGAGFATAEEIVLTDVDQNEQKAFYLKVVTGTVKMGVGEVTANAHGWTSADVVPPITCKNGKLYFTAAASTDTFVVTASPA
jgi:hypothetical protein